MTLDSSLSKVHAQSVTTRASTCQMTATTTSITHKLHTQQSKDITNDTVSLLHTNHHCYSQLDKNGQMDMELPISWTHSLVAKTRSPRCHWSELHACARQTPGASQGTHRSTACATTIGVGTLEVPRGLLVG